MSDNGSRKIRLSGIRQAHDLGSRGIAWEHCRIPLSLLGIQHPASTRKARLPRSVFQGRLSPC